MRRSQSPSFMSIGSHDPSMRWWVCIETSLFHSKKR